MNKKNIDLVINWINTNNLDGFIVPHDDEFMSEYLPPHNERLAWLSNFTGSAGAAVILKHKSAIFVDGRYTVQVQQQVDRQNFEILHLINDPYLIWIKNNISEGAKIGFDPKLHSYQWFMSAKKTIGNSYSLIPIKDNPIDSNWENRELRKYSDILLLSEDYTGKKTDIKRQEIAKILIDKSCDSAIISRLDSIAWLLNIRGEDVPCNPVLLSYGILLSDGSFKIFIDNEIPVGFKEHVGNNVEIFKINQFEIELNKLKNQSILFDPFSNTWIAQCLQNIDCKLVICRDPCVLPKACKNKIEINGMKNSHVRDGVAVCEFLSWLNNEIVNISLLDEAILSDKLETFRKTKDKFKGLSFSTISASAENAAMCHYNHNNQDIPGKLKVDSVYLVDSGGQYLDGTTDITRTVAIGAVSDEIQKAFTLVLKGHIALASAIFPKGTSGLQLDTLARQFLWSEGLNYDHGTGHGVGCFLNVHEGPQGISQKGTNVPLEIGMVVSNEPGYYLEDSYGIRCENLVFVKETSNNRNYFEFENLTMVPFDRNLICNNLLTDKELEWINNYHSQVNKTISPFLKGEDLSWLRKSTQFIAR